MFEPLSRSVLDAPDAFESSIADRWESSNHLDFILAARSASQAFVFYEGPPTANGRPGIHHVLARTLKDLICRYHTMKGMRVERKAGWDTHGLPVELEVEKQLGISGKPEIEDIGIGPFNEACRNSVFTYKAEWEALSKRMGYLLDYENPYVTFEDSYIESLWFIVSRFAANDLLYQGHKVLPWCGRCGTGLSSHEVAQGYQDIDDPSVWMTFPLLTGQGPLENAHLVGWTTTPWTLPSNMGVCVHPEFEYAIVETGNVRYILLESKLAEVFAEGSFELIGRVSGVDLVGLSYEPLFEFEGGDVVLEGARRHIVTADEYVTADDGTGIVHLAPYGADDFRIAQREGIQAVLAVGSEAKFLCKVDEVESGTFFRDANKYLSQTLKDRGRLLKRSQCNHSYPHCWRCETPLIYFPSPAWFLKTTHFKDLMVEKNKEINWAPPEIGEGRFGEWLENNIDWALSRDRYWGTPLPVWVCEIDSQHWDCMESFAELNARAGGLPDGFDPHRPMVDEPVLSCSHAECDGQMRRVPQVLDAWFDSGAMPFAQHHWPFENRDKVAEQFPADFIAEGLDQTRGWFYTLHALSTFLTCVDEDLWESGELWGEPLPRLRPGGGYRSVLVNGLLLDSKGQKMSKRLGNIVVPSEAMEKHGVDAIRWGLLAGGASHLSRRFDDRSIGEVRRRILGTLTASYDFFALYARTEGWKPESVAPPLERRPAMDRWILSRVKACATSCGEGFENLEPARALRSLEQLIVDEVSNWYIRQNRRRFWNSEDSDSQLSAFATLHDVLSCLSRLIAPITPFLAEALHERLGYAETVHLMAYPSADGFRDLDLEQAMDPILRAASLGRSIRERVGIRVRQPLQKLVLHVSGAGSDLSAPMAHEESLKRELNVREIEWLDSTPDFLELKAKANFPRLGKRAGKHMKALAAAIGALSREEVFSLQGGGSIEISLGDEEFILEGEDVLVETLSVEGLEAAADGVVTLGLVTELDEDLLLEGLAREVVNRLQGLRKSTGLEISDRISVRAFGSERLHSAILAHADWIRKETLIEGELLWEENQGDSFELPGAETVVLAIALYKKP